MNMVRVLLVDDETLIREGVATILSLQPDIEVVGQALDGLQAVQLAGKTKPDVVLVDLVMPRQDGLHTIPILKDLLPDTKILVLTSFAESDKVYQAVKSGALGYLLKDANRVDLLQAIRDVANGQASIPPSIAIKLIHEIDHPSQTNYTEYPLTDREHQTLQLIARGLSNREIARALF